MVCNSTNFSQPMAGPAGQDVSSSLHLMHDFISVPQPVSPAQMPVGMGLVRSFANPSTSGTPLPPHFSEAFLLPDQNGADSVMSQIGHSSSQISSSHDFNPSHQINQSDYEQHVAYNNSGGTSFHSDSIALQPDSNYLVDFESSDSSDSFDSLFVDTDDYEIWKNISDSQTEAASVSFHAMSPHYNPPQYSFDSTDAVNLATEIQSSQNAVKHTIGTPEEVTDGNNVVPAAVNQDVVFTQAQSAKHAGSGLLSPGSEIAGTRMPQDSSSAIHRSSTSSKAEPRPGNPMSNVDAGAGMTDCSDKSERTYSLAENPNGHEMLADSLDPFKQSAEASHSSPTHHANNASPKIDSNTSGILRPQSQESYQPDPRGRHIRHEIKRSTSVGGLDNFPTYSSFSQTVAVGTPITDMDNEHNLPRNTALAQKINGGLAERPALYRNKILESLGCAVEGSPTNTEFSSLEDATEKMKGKFQKPEDDPTLPTTDSQKRAIVKDLLNFWVDTSSSNDNARYRENFKGKSKDLKEIEWHCWEILENTIKYAREGPLVMKKYQRKQTGNLDSFASRMAALYEVVHRHKTKCDILQRPSLLLQLVQDPLGQQKQTISNQYVNKRKAISLEIGNKEVKRRQVDRASASPVPEQHCSPTNHDETKPKRRVRTPRAQHSPSGSSMPRLRRETICGTTEGERQLKEREARARRYDALNTQQPSNISTFRQPFAAGMRRHSTPVFGMNNTTHPNAFVSQMPLGYGNIEDYSAPRLSSSPAVNTARQYVHPPENMREDTLSPWMTSNLGHTQQPLNVNPQYDQMAQDMGNNNAYAQAQQPTRQSVGISPLMKQYYQRMGMLRNQHPSQFPSINTPAMSHAIGSPQPLQQAFDPRNNLALKRHNSGL